MSPRPRGLPSCALSRPVTPEGRRSATEHALRRTKPVFHLTDGQVEHIGEVYRRRSRRGWEHGVGRAQR